MGMQEDSRELWFREHPWATTAELAKLLCGRALTATPRLGERNEHHPKGYIVGQRTMAKLSSIDGKTEIVAVEIEVTGLAFRPLKDLAPEDLVECGPAYPNAERVGSILGYFERRTIQPGEMVTVVRFAYRGEPKIAGG